MVQDMSGSTLAPRCASEKGKTSTTAWMPKACAWRGTFNFFGSKSGKSGEFTPEVCSSEAGVNFESSCTLLDFQVLLSLFLTSSCQFLTRNRSTVQPNLTIWSARRSTARPGVAKLGPRSAETRWDPSAGQTFVTFAAGRWADKVGEEHPGAAPPPGLLFKHGKIVDV